MQVFVKLYSGKTLVIDVVDRKAMKVSNVKEIIADRTLVPVRVQKLAYRGKILADDTSLEQIDDGATIFSLIGPAQ